MTTPTPNSVAPSPSTSGRRSTWARRAGTGARVLAGAVVAVAVVGLSVAAVHVPWPGVTASPVSQTVTPTSGAATLVCPGGPLIGSRDGQNASAIALAADPATVAGGDPDPTTSTIASTPDSVGEGSVLRAESTQPGTPADAAAAQASTASADDIVGFSAAACTAPAFESWLVGGATTLGESAFLVIANPGDVVATIDVTVFGGGDPVTAPAGTDVAVRAQSRVVIPLASLAPSEPAPVVRVTATGTGVVTALAVAVTQTLQPVGSDVVSPAAAPAPTNVIPGVVVPAAVGSGFGPATVRLVAPDAATTATVTAVPVGGGAAAQTVTVDLAAGQSAETTLTGLDAGAYNIWVTAAVPVVAGVLTATDGARDLAWVGAAPTLTSDTLVAVPADGATLTVANAASGAGSASPASVALTPLAGGAMVTTQNGTATLAAGVWRLRVETPVSAAISYSGDGKLAAYPVPAGARQAVPVTVVP
ncbi:DUF5719 family protein [uncultured Microbacterium sp.]|uniref:DUF5719 family protein n=1 Tax=uncultured Microbacterium sp. TaxID=191216 RepID=UPI0026004CA1|nr:DUF5719 family protein [uncultured Microbacterium sp.]